MNDEQLKGRWTHFQGDIKQQWGKFTDDDLKQRNLSAHFRNGMLSGVFAKHA